MNENFKRIFFLLIIINRKYERCKQILIGLKTTEEKLKSESKELRETLKQQEIRYGKMKNHAISQLDL